MNASPVHSWRGAEIHWCCGSVLNQQDLEEVSALSISPWTVTAAFAVVVWLSVSHLPGTSVGVSACGFTDENPAAQYVLTPGGMVTADGLVVAAPLSSLTEPVSLSVSTGPDPRSRVPFPEFLEHAVVLSDFFSLAADRDVQPQGSTYLLLGIELPDDVQHGQLGVAVLTPADSVLGFLPDDDPSRRWDFLTGVVDPDTGLFGVTLTSLTVKPQVFVLVLQP